MSHSSARKILLVSWHFPPYKSSSAFNLFKRLKDTGYEYDVLQIKRGEKPDNEGMFRFASSRFNRYEIEVPTEDARNSEARAHYVAKVLDFYQRLKDRNHYRVVLSHSHEIASHLAAMAIKRANPEIRWLASFGDPIAANPYNESYKFAMLEDDCRTEAEVLQMADRIIVTNPYHQKIVQNSQSLPVDSEKFFILPHCFDERMFHRESSSVQSNRQEREQDSVFRFMHVGMLYKFKRTSEPFMLGARRLLEKHPELKGRFTLEFYGANDRYIQAASDYGLEGIVRFQGTVSYLESLTVMDRADCLLLRDADFSDQGLKETPFYPGKLADYLGAKKPILAITMARGCVPDMMEEVGGAYFTENDIDGIADGMWSAIQGRLVTNATEAEHYSYRQIRSQARRAMKFSKDKKKILIAGHDLKFAKFIMSAIEQRDDLELLVDQWRGHNNHDQEQSLRLLNQADTVFCEWGLGNAVWYSRHKKAGQKLVVRVHAQELRTRHLDQCLHENIDNYIFVSPYYFELMISEFSLCREKCKMVFNMVDTSLLDKPKLPNARFHLGMIGDVPQSKRLDRALDIFEKLYLSDKRYRLFVKGKRPEDYPWMHSKAKAEEMQFYRAQYQRIVDSGWQDCVIFDGYGPIDEWFQKVGWILSVSDHESFHLSVAEGMASGAYPVILNWPGAETIYPPMVIEETIDGAVNTILSGGDEIDVKNVAEVFCKKAQTKIILDIIDAQ
ncbi:glycosyltransferase [Paracoccus seriniphilus]|uniref:Glycosyltransferase involved in cell wall bisynthesis n=1 Tax=Paracoccus seriniphilus TaxID=184748 RepID=A0A239Q3K0_9RHOB|nr:glycosyltransferase [Paracoccus seriniphilus]WCR15561.1 glycosyltransferase [Paracoccus seriniphilus]SNT76888.1 Glycosyltransferase involved in cell wall bisynthesis [Paracoccus seriniphilus]